MIRVTVETAMNQQMDLLPVNMQMRDVLGHFHLAGAVNSVNGAILEEEDLDRYLREFSENAEVCILSCPKTEEESEAVFLAEPFISVDPERQEQQAMEKVRDLLREALAILGTVPMPPEESPPF